MTKPAPIVEPDFDPATGDIRHILDIGLLAQKETKPEKVPTGWYASSLGKCLRSQFFARAGVPPTQPIRNPRTLWVGSVLEHAIIARLRHSGLLRAEQVHLVSEEHHASGYLDFIYGGFPVEDDIEEGWSPEWADYVREYRERIRRSYPNGVPMTAVELKSAAQYSAEKMQSEGPRFDHQMQGGFYEVAVEEDPTQLPEGIDKLDRFQIVVIAKSDAKMLVFDILESHKLKVLGRLDELNEAWPLEYPACTCGRVMSWEKTYCNYRVGSSCCDERELLNASPAFWQAYEEAGGEVT